MDFALLHCCTIRSLLYSINCVNNRKKIDKKAFIIIGPFGAQQTDTKHKSKHVTAFIAID